MKHKLLPLLLLSLTTMVLAGGYPPRFSVANPTGTDLYAPEPPSFLGSCAITYGDESALPYRTANERCASDEVLLYNQCVPHIDPTTGETYGQWEDRSLVCSAMKAGLVCYNNKCSEGRQFTGLSYYLIPLAVLVLVIGGLYYGYKKYKEGR